MLKPTAAANDVKLSRNKKVAYQQHIPFRGFR
jgi:hypothetical protein